MSELAVWPSSQMPGINSMNAVLFRNKLITEFKETGISRATEPKLNRQQDVELPTTLVRV